MKYRLIFARVLSLFLCGLLVLAPLPTVWAAPDDDGESVSDNDSNDGDTEGGDTEGEDSADDNGDSNSDISTDTTDAGWHDPLMPEDPHIKAKSAILVNPDTGMVLYEYNADQSLPPASTTKIMTALLTLEHADINDTVTAIESDFEKMDSDSSTANIQVGEKVRIIDLLYCLMLPSANEAAYMLARHVGGTYDNFVEMMNVRATELGCTGTHFSNPCGLHDDGLYSTARDLERIAEQAMKDETFAEVVKAASKTISATNVHPERQVFSTNYLLFSRSQPWFYPYCNGIKTGHTSQAGNCLVAFAEKSKAKLFSVVLGCADAPTSQTVAESFTETSRLFEWGYNNFSSKTLAQKGDAIIDIDVRLSADTDKLTLTAKNDLTVSVPKNLSVSDMELTTTVPESKNAPIKAGEVIGSRTYSYAGVTYGTVELVALTDVDRSQVLYIADKLENFFKSAIFKGALVVATIFVVLYLLFNITFGGMRRRRQREKLRSRYESANYRRRRRK